MKKLAIILGIIIILMVIVIWLNFYNNNSLFPKSSPKQSILPPKSDASKTKVIAENLDTPWSIVFLPDKSMLVTERPGRVRVIDSNGNLQSKPVAVLNNAKEIGEGGLLGITLHPNFFINNYVYLYYTYSVSSGNTLNRVVRMTYKNNLLKNEEIIIDEIPGASNHNGGRIKFGPDGYLYITTGDAQNPSQAQDTNSLAGKIFELQMMGRVLQEIHLTI